MKITVVTVVLNDEAHIRDTIESILAQDWPDMEYIIIDGGSTDGTLTVIREYQSNIHRLISESDDGIYPAMNKGIALASGEFIIFMNSGDTFFNPAVVSRVFGEVHSSADIIYGDTQFRYPDGKTRVVRAHPPYEIWKPFFNHQAAFFRTRLLISTGFDPEYRPASDFQFIMYVQDKGAKFAYIQMIVNTYLVGGDVFHQEFKTIMLYRRIVQKYNKSFRVNRFYFRKILWIGFITALVKPVLPLNIFFHLQRLYRRFFPESQ